MRQTRLIILDGLPGSGKSTTAQWLELQLHRNGFDAHWYWEGDVPHPLWWYGYWTGAEYMPPDWARLNPSQCITRSVQKWRDFVAAAEMSDAVHIVESFPLQNGMGMLLMGGAEGQELIGYARVVEEIIRPLNPALVYFYQSDVVRALRCICDLRGKDTERELIANMESFPYLRNRGLKGFDGVAALWRAIRELCDQALAEYTIPKLAIENSAADWPRYWQQIANFLALTTVEDSALVTRAELERYEGRYRDDEGHTRIVLLDRDELLMVHVDNRRDRLIPRDAYNFDVGGVPRTVRFAVNEPGTVEQMEIDERRTGGTIRILRRES